MNIHEFIHSRITELRLHKGISERQLSKAIGKNGTYLSSLVSKNRLPSYETLEDICRYLGITLSEFFDKNLLEHDTANGLYEYLKDNFNNEDIKLLFKIFRSIDVDNLKGLMDSYSKFSNTK